MAALAFGYGRERVELARRFKVTVGDRFAKAGQPGQVYEVINMVERPGFPQHVQLRLIGSSGAPLLMSASALTDPHFYVRQKADATG